MSRALTWSFGGGTQSVAIAVLVAEGKLPTPEVIVMADTGYEATETWEYLRDHVQPLLGGVEAKVEVIKASEWATTKGLRAKNGKILMPVFTEEGEGQLPNYCTNEWKVRPVRRFLRSRGYGPKSPVTTWIGISIDEVHRAKPSGVEWQEYEYPLLFDAPHRRDECVALVGRAGLPSPPKSSCYFCPYRGNRQWRRVRDKYPEDWEKAVRIDEKLREIDPDAYVHRSGVPLADASLRGSPSQPDLFKDQELECDSGYCWV